LCAHHKEADVRSDVRAIPEGMHTITPHIVVRDAARASAAAFGG
jgi:hypothetical protein